MIKKAIYNFLRYCPYAEVLIRRIYYSQKLNVKFIQKPSNKKLDIIKDPSLFDKVISEIKEFGIDKGDILIVHSSMDGLEKTDAIPEMFINTLLDLVGNEGTLVFPAFPMEKKMKKAKDGGSGNEDYLIYDPQKTPSWTGLMPNIFCRYPGVIRSLFPHNSLAAKGKHAEAMMKDNLNGNLAHGEYSAWEYCINHHAKILFLGLLPYHCNTVIHVAEDLLSDSWPIRDWYEHKKYLVVTPQGNKLVTSRERRRYWARYIAEHNVSYKLTKKNLLMEKNIGGIDLGFISDSKKVVQFLINEAKSNRISYIIPKKYWKNV